MEKAIGTNPNKMDTDGDGYNDLAEIKNGYSPIVAGPGGKYTSEQLQALKDKMKTASDKFYEKEFGEADVLIEQNKAIIASYKSVVSGIQAAVVMCCDETKNSLQTTPGADACKPSLKVNLPAADAMKATNVSYAVLAQCSKNDPGLSVTPSGLPVAACNAAATVRESGVIFPEGC